jgi:hypothetical protein
MFAGPLVNNDVNLRRHPQGAAPAGWMAQGCSPAVSPGKEHSRSGVLSPVARRKTCPELVPYYTADDDDETGKGKLDCREMNGDIKMLLFG